MLPKLKSVYQVFNEDSFLGIVEFWDFSGSVNSIPEIVSLVASTSTASRIKNPEKLISKLIQMGHESPFEFVSWWDEEEQRRITLRERDDLLNKDSPLIPVRDFKNSKIFTFRLTVPLFVARQIMRHRSFSYMELSRRYVKHSKFPFKFYIPPKHKTFYKIINLFSLFTYKILLRVRVKPELARLVIPQSMFTTFWMQGDYKAFANFFLYRLHPSTQKETRLIAQTMFEALKAYRFDGLIWGYLDKFVSEPSVFQKARRNYLREMIEKRIPKKKFWEEIL